MKTKDLKQELDNIMASTAANQAFVEASMKRQDSGLPPELEEPEPLFTVDFEMLRFTLESDAKKIVEDMVADILPARYLESQFIRRQIEVDSKSLGAVYYQQALLMKVEEACIMSISTGNLGPRMVEVTNATAENYTKHTKQASDMIAMLRKNYIDIMLDIQQRESSEQMLLGSSQDGQQRKQLPGDKQIYVGSKEIIDNLKARKLEAMRAKANSVNQQDN